MTTTIPYIHEQHLRQAGRTVQTVLGKILANTRITRDEAIALYHSNDLLSLGMLADTARRLRTPAHARDHVYWVHNLHINPTNICEANCKFCSFKKGPKSPNAYKQSVDDVIEMVHAYPHYKRLAEFHIVAGLWHELDLDYYVRLFSALNQEFPHVHIKALTAVEMDYLAQIEGIPVESVLRELKAAGLGSMPGGGAEVFSERVREAVCVDKTSAEEWLRIHGLAHGMGIKSNATLLAGLGETAEERIDHMLAIREQQDRSGGFMTFIPLNCYYDNNRIDASNALTGVENLKNFAVSRLLLDNVPHLKAFWIHIGEKISQVALHFGVDDLDGTVVQEKIAHAAGTDAAQHLTEADLVNMIRKAGRIPVERDTTYSRLRVMDSDDGTGLPPETEAAAIA